MKRMSLWVLGVSALVVLASLAVVNWPGRSHAGGVHLTVFLPDDAQTETAVDLGTPGDGPGDRVVTTATLFDAGTPDRQVGTLVGDGMMVDDGRFQSQFEMFLKDGSLMAYGVSAFGEDSALAVIGGTGKYRGVDRSLTVHRTTAGGKEGTLFSLG
jgi:hypothetical protein